MEEEEHNAEVRLEVYFFGFIIRHIFNEKTIVEYKYGQAIIS